MSGAGNGPDNGAANGAANRAANGAANGATHDLSGDITLDALRAALRDRYDVQRQLGRGGMGAVYLARDVQLDRPVAIKVLPSEFVSHAALRDRFLRETRMAASFSHPNIVPVFSVEDRDGLLAFAMGYIEGESLAERVKRAGALSVKELVRLLQDIGYALAYAHGRGVVHRDIKPDNIMLERATGRALLMDFGISRVITPVAAGATQALTRIGEVVGTPEFMSPEQASGDDLDGRSDLYSLGLVAWFAATGHLAISGESTQKILVKQLTELIPPVLPLRTDLPRALADAIDRCVRKDPNERFASADELVDTLDVAKLAGPEVPLPIRLFAEEASQSTLVVVGGLVMGALLYVALHKMYEGNLDIIPKMVMFGALMWGRLSLTHAHARRIALRGFGVAEIQHGIAAVVRERDAERAQLRADAPVVAKRRKQVISSLVLLAASYAIDWYVDNYQRVLLKPGWYGVKTPGAVLYYVASVTRGLTIIGLLNSPLRRSPVEWLSGWFWTGTSGRWILTRISRGVQPSSSGSNTTGNAPVPPSAAVRTPSVSAAPLPQPSSATLPAMVQRLEERVAALEQWRNSGPNG